MTLMALLQWESVITQLITLGVKSWSVIRAALADAGVDEDTIALLKPKWDSLESDVARAAGK